MSVRHVCQIGMSMLRQETPYRLDRDTCVFMILLETGVARRPQLFGSSHSELASKQANYTLGASIVGYQNTTWTHLTTYASGLKFVCLKVEKKILGTGKAARCKICGIFVFNGLILHIRNLFPINQNIISYSTFKESLCEIVDF